MELNKLEGIIEAQMKNVYEKQHRCYVTEQDNLNNEKIVRRYNIISGSNLIGYCDVRNKITDPYERARETMLNKHIDFVYMNRKIHLYMDENWTNTEIADFLNKTIGQKDIVGAINSGYLQLTIDGLDKENSIVVQKEIPAYEWRAAKRNNWNIFRIVDELINIGIDVKLQS